MTTLFEELTWRGLIYDSTEGLSELLAKEERVTAYVGFDPTASSLHVGHLLGVLALRRLQLSGHTPIAVVGGGTGMIGDPSGKSQERVLLSQEKIEENIVGIRKQLERRFLDFEGSNAAQIVNNADWLGTIDLLTFLRDVGKHFTVNYMLQKESVSRRLESEDGISFTEFSYLMLQSYDFLQLSDRFNCSVQLGGSDQWGNITAGIELIRKLRARKAHGLVWPLMKSSSGVKFGKTEAGAVWLDPARTSPYKFYQFWLNTNDADVENYLKCFTYKNDDEIKELLSALPPDADARYRQRVLAEDVTRLVHGPDLTLRAQKASELLFTEHITGIPVDDVLSVFEDVPSTDVPTEEFGAEGLGVVDLIARVQLAPSKSEARRLLQSGGVYVNNRRVSDLQARLKRDEAIGGRLFVLRKGQKQYHLVRLT